MFGFFYRFVTAEATQPSSGVWADSLLARACIAVSAIWYATHIAGSAEPYVIAIPFAIRFALATVITLGVARMIACVGILSRFAAPFYCAILLALYAQNPALVAPAEIYGLTVLSAIVLCGSLVIGTSASLPRALKSDALFVPFFTLQMIGAFFGALYQDKSLSELVVATLGLWLGAALLFAIFSIWMVLYTALFSRNAHCTDRSA